MLVETKIGIDPFEVEFGLKLHVLLYFNLAFPLVSIYSENVPATKQNISVVIIHVACLWLQNIGNNLNAHA